MTSQCIQAVRVRYLSKLPTCLDCLVILNGNDSGVGEGDIDVMLSYPTYPSFAFKPSNPLDLLRVGAASLLRYCTVPSPASLAIACQAESFGTWMPLPSVWASNRACSDLRLLSSEINSRLGNFCEVYCTLRPPSASILCGLVQALGDDGSCTYQPSHLETRKNQILRIRGVNFTVSTLLDDKLRFYPLADPCPVGSELLQRCAAGPIRQKQIF